MKIRKFLTVLTIGAALAASFTGCASTKAAPAKPQGRIFQHAPGEKSVLFKTFGGCGVQIWANEWGQHELTFDIDYIDGCIYVGPVGWWGGSFGAYDNGVPNGAHYDLSNIAEIRFEAKASSYGTFYFNIDNNNKNEIDVSPKFKEYTINTNNLSRKTDVLFQIGGVRDLSNKDTQVWIKNIAFYDEDGNEVVPQYN